MKTIKFSLKKESPLYISLSHGSFGLVARRGERDYWECTGEEWEKIVRPSGYFEKHKTGKDRKNA